LIVSLSGSDSGAELTLPSTVTIPAGQRFASFSVTAVPDTTPDGPVSVTVTAMAPDTVSGTVTVSVVDSLPTPSPLPWTGGFGWQAADAVFSQWDQRG
jgi:hypothetical protein